MKATLVYPFPLVSTEPATPADARSVFAPFAKRFAATYLLHPVGGEHEVLVVFGGDVGNAEDREIFARLPKVRFATCAGAGIDIGTAQYAARHLACGEFIVGMTSRVYFHRPGALQRLLNARSQHGRGLYGAMGSFERCPTEPETFPNPHLRTVWYMMDTADFRQYPFTISSRRQAHCFEAGTWNYMQWFLDRGLPVRMVTWDAEYAPKDFRHAAIQNGFRRGTQADCLVWDKHTDAWRDASPAVKRAWAIAAGDK